MIQIDEWANCYNSGWGTILTPAAYSHPAKFSLNLITKIVKHALEEGWIQPGQTVLDPFSGVACGAWPCLQYGLNYVGVELESKFVELGRENIALWNDRYAAHFPNWGTAQILQGDSRRLAEVVKGAGLVVSSPPYAQLETKTGKVDEAAWTDGRSRRIGASQRESDGYGSTPGQLATLPPGDISALIASPPFAGNSGGRGEASRNGIDSALFDRHSGGMKGGTGSDPANLDHLPMGTLVVSSPPYVDSMEKSGGIDPDKSNHIGGPHSQMNRSDTRYGETDGQLGAMKAGAVIGSPPFSPGQSTGGEAPKFLDGKPRSNNGIGHNYGSDPDQLGNAAHDTFWAAAKTIIDQCYQILPQNAHAIWVVKNYIKAGREVDFTGQWQQLCEACGFETVHVHRAMLVKRNGSQARFDGEMVSKDVARKSFFRRLHERRRPDLAIDFETVLCTVKR